MLQMVSQITKIWNHTKFTFQNLTVEPIIFFVYLGWVFGNTIQSPGLYRKICEIYYGDYSDVNCYRITSHEIEDSVQQHAAEWTVFNVLSYLLPAIFADILLGAYGDRHGRKTIIALGIFGITLVEFGFLLTLSVSVATPYWTTLLFGAAGGMTGFIAMIPVSCNAYLADTTEDPDLLTIRSGYFTGFQLLASIVGALLAAALSSVISIPAAIDVEIGLFVVALFFTLWKVPQKPGLKEIDRRVKVHAIRPVGGEPKKNKPLGQKLAEFIAELRSLLCSGFEVYKKPRDGHRRAFMFIVVFVLVLSLTTSVETRTSGIINSFVFRRTEADSLDWSARDLGLWNGTGYTLLLIGTLTGLLLFKKVLKMRETSIILIGLTSSCLRTLLIASSVEDWMMYVANALGLFSGLVQPAAVSFIAQIVPPAEIGRVFSLFGIGADLAFIISTLVYSNIYRATVPWSPGFLFYLIALIQFLAILIMFWVHVKSKMEGIGKEGERRKMTTVQNAISRIGEAAVENGVKLKKTNSKMGKRQVSIIQHAEELANQRKQSALWESVEDVRAHPSARTAFY